MQYFLREIGQGPKGARNLTREEARDAMSLILAGEAKPAQAGGFLLLERFKGESSEELLGFAQAIREGANMIRPKVPGLLDVGSPYDGRKRSIVVSPASAIVVAAAGVPVVMHGEKGLGPKHGVPVGDVLEALGVAVDAEPAEVERRVKDDGFGYMRQARFVPQVFALKDLREEVALRTAISTIEKIYNLAGADFSIIGLTHLPYAQKMMLAASQMGFKRILIIQGIEGNEDAPTSRPCRAFLWNLTPTALRPGSGQASPVAQERGGPPRDGRGEGTTEELRIDASDYGLQPASREEMAGGDAARNAEIAARILDGEMGGHRDLVLLNAGIRIWLSEQAASIGEGIARAREALDSGAARAKLEALRQRRKERGRGHK